MEVERFDGQCLLFASRDCRGECDAAAVVFREDLGKDLVQAIDQSLCGAEIGREGCKVELPWLCVWNFEPDLLDTGKQFRVGFAKEVDRLHGIADEEAGSLCPHGVEFRPCTEQACQQPVLAAAGVLNSSTRRW